MSINNDSDNENDYKQDLGLKKILYKYENENQQLRSQIKALNERLSSIVNKPPSESPQKAKDPIQQFQGKIMKEEMEKLFKEINRESEQMKENRNSIDERHEEKCKEVNNRIVRVKKEIKGYKDKLVKYELLDEGIKVGSNLMFQQKGLVDKGPSSNMPVKGTLRNSTVRVQSYLEKLNQILEETEAARRSIKELEKQRDSNHRRLKEKHMHQVDVKVQNKQLIYGKPEGEPLEEARKRKGIWGLENTTQNYEFLAAEILKVKREQREGLDGIRNENIVLDNKLMDVEDELEGLNKSVEIPPLPYHKKQVKTPINLSMAMSTKLESPLMKKSQRMDVGPTEFESNNDKNYVPKKLRQVSWESTKNKAGIEWYDGNLKSPIIGVNMWLDKTLLGIQFIQESGNSAQHLHLMGGKKIIPIQYRLGEKDYVENIVLYISEGLICGVQFTSCAGRSDSFGIKNKAMKFDFGIRKPEKPLITLGQFRVNKNNCSEITKLGFQII